MEAALQLYIYHIPIVLSVIQSPDTNYNYKTVEL